MTAKLSSLNKLVDQYNNTYHHSINKKSINPFKTVKGLVDYV